MRAMSWAQAYSPKTKCCQQVGSRHSFKWKSIGVPSFPDQLRIVQEFKTIRELAVQDHEEAAHAMQSDASSILQIAKGIQKYAPRCMEVAEAPWT